MDYYPVFSSDPNGPWRTDTETGEVWLVGSTTDPDLIDSYNAGDFKVGDTIIMFQPNEPTDGGPNEYGWGYRAVLKRWAPTHTSGYYLIYTMPLEQS